MKRVVMCAVHFLPAFPTGLVYFVIDKTQAQTFYAPVHVLGCICY